MPIPVSMLDFAPVAPGSTMRDAFEACVEIARTAEASGYRRVWYAEHHNMPSIASAATSVVIGHVAAHTSTIRLGSGGIMLPNHSPLVIAEQFGTLATLFPGRIDLGLGRAPGTDQRTMYAMRRTAAAADSFPQDVLELEGYLTGDSRVPGVQAVPRPDGPVPLYILGSSLFGAQLAAELGMPYGFASHFAPDALYRAVALYRERFKPSERLEEPHLMVGINVFAADTHEAAVEQQIVSQRSRARSMIRHGGGQNFDDEQIDAFLASPNGAPIANMTRLRAVGTPAEVRDHLREFAASTGADELIVSHPTSRTEDRVRSVELTAEAMADIG